MPTSRKPKVYETTCWPTSDDRAAFPPTESRTGHLGNYLLISATSKDEAAELATNLGYRTLAREMRVAVGNTNEAIIEAGLVRDGSVLLVGGQFGREVVRVAVLNGARFTTYLGELRARTGYEFIPAQP